MGSTDAVILVGGLGTRLRPLTLSAPKPMLPTAGVPFLTHLVSRIREAGVTHVVLGTSYRADVFESYFGDGAALGVDAEARAALTLRRDAIMGDCALQHGIRLSVQTANHRLQCARLGK